MTGIGLINMYPLAYSNKYVKIKFYVLRYPRRKIKDHKRMVLKGLFGKGKRVIPCVKGGFTNRKTPFYSPRNLPAMRSTSSTPHISP